MELSFIHRVGFFFRRHVGVLPCNSEEKRKIHIPYRYMQRLNSFFQNHCTSFHFIDRQWTCKRHLIFLLRNMPNYKCTNVQRHFVCLCPTILTMASAPRSSSSLSSLDAVIVRDPLPDLVCVDV